MTVSVVVLVSEGRHPSSGRPRRADQDARALELALRIPDSDVHVVHAGQETSPVLRDYLGMGVKAIHVLSIPPDANPFSPMRAWLEARQPDLILTGQQAEGGEGSGFLPYKIAHDLARPLLSNICALTVKDDKVEGLQALARGQRKRLRASMPAVLTVGSAAPTPRQSAFAKARRGKIITMPVAALHPIDPPWTAVPAKKRAVRLKTVDPTLSPEERLRQITEMTGKEGEVLDGLSADDVADRLLAYLDQHGITHNTTSHP